MIVKEMVEVEVDLNGSRCGINCQYEFLYDKQYKESIKCDVFSKAKCNLFNQELSIKNNDRCPQCLESVGN